MKSLWIISKDSEYRLGWWDEDTKSWQLNDILAENLIALLKSLQVGDPDNGVIPNLKIETRN